MNKIYVIISWYSNKNNKPKVNFAKDAVAASNIENKKTKQGKEVEIFGISDGSISYFKSRKKNK